MIRPKFDPPRGVLKTSVAGRPGLRHARYHASTDLELYVEHYWAVEWDLLGRAPERVETLPHPSVHLVFDHEGGGRVSGVTRRKFSRMLTGRGWVVAAKFRPGGFYPFIRRPVSDLSDRSWAIKRVLRTAEEDLAGRVLEQPDDEARIVVIEDFLRSCQPTPDDHVAGIARMVYAVAKDRGILKVDDLVERYGLNKRTLQRLFAKYVGVSPKWVIQLYRLHEAAQRLESGKAINQSALAFTLGYSDQAHFVRDFKSILGVSPAAYARRLDPAQ